MAHKKCLECGEEIKDRYPSAKYCNEYCANKFYRKSYKKNSLRYDLNLKKEEIFKIKGKECLFCKSSKKLNIHHIDYKSNKLANLIILCQICHSKLHHILTKHKLKWHT